MRARPALLLNRICLTRDGRKDPGSLDEKLFIGVTAVLSVFHNPAKSKVFSLYPPGAIENSCGLLRKTVAAVHGRP